MQDSRYISIAAAAEYLGVSTSTLRRLIQSEALRILRLPTGTPRVDRQDLDALLHLDTEDRRERSDR